MPLIAGKPFTQLTNLNVEELRINGVLVSPGGGTDIVEITGNYSQQIDDDILFVTGTFTVTLVAPATGIKPIVIRSISGTTTITPTSGTTETTVLTAGQSITMAPRSSGWFNI